MAEHQLTCKTCGAQFQSVQPRTVSCSDECRRERKRRNSKPKRLTSVTYDCWWCGKQYHPKRVSRNKSCSRECGFKVKDFLRAARHSRGIVSVSVQRRRCVLCNAPFTQGGRETTCSAECDRQKWRIYYEPVAEAKCRECGNDFSRASDGATRWMCSLKCRDISASRTRRAGKASRKAMERGAQRGQSIDPIKVFERDAWRCGICGGKTDKTRRGTYHHKAPELDHIVALANGGTHTWENVQCACRSCNGAKGASDYGQLTLFPKP